MSDLAARIRARAGDPVENCLDPQAAAHAVMAVLDLHQPYPDTGLGWTDGGYDVIPVVCGTCGTPDEYGVPYPCPTVKALAEVLGLVQEVETP